MMTQKITEYDGLTKQTIERKPTKAESLDFDARAEKIELFLDKAAQKAEAKKTAQTKLAALGLTVDELQAILG